MNWITQVGVETRHDTDTGWREPILISGQGKAVQASYCADGLVFFGALPADEIRRDDLLRPIALETDPRMWRPRIRSRPDDV